MTTRNVRSGVEDRWHKADGSRSAKYGISARWRARYVDGEGTEREKVFSVKKDAQTFLTDRMSAVHTGSHLDPAAGKVSVERMHMAWVTPSPRKPRP